MITNGMIQVGHFGDELIWLKAILHVKMVYHQEIYDLPHRFNFVIHFMIIINICGRHLLRKKTSRDNSKCSRAYCSSSSLTFVLEILRLKLLRLLDLAITAHKYFPIANEEQDLEIDRKLIRNFIIDYQKDTN